ncbi:MAG: discoidin domain-containing protein [Chloroflexota bacterium]
MRDHTGVDHSATYSLNTSSGVTVRSNLENISTTYPQGRFYAFVVWDGVLSSDDIAAAQTYFSAHIPNWVDVAGLEDAIYSSDSSTSSEDLAVDRNLDTGWTSDEGDTAWWQVEFPDPQTVQRIDVVPHNDDGYSGVPHFQLLASNTGDFDSEEVLLVEADPYNGQTRRYNVFFFENSTAYTFYRVVISGLTDVQYMLEEVFLYVVE